jgi:hypothetical protein
MRGRLVGTGCAAGGAIGITGCTVGCGTVSVGVGTTMGAGAVAITVGILFAFETTWSIWLFKIPMMLFAVGITKTIVGNQKIRGVPYSCCETEKNTPVVIIDGQVRRLRPVPLQKEHFTTLLLLILRRYGRPPWSTNDRLIRYNRKKVTTLQGTKTQVCDVRNPLNPDLSFRISWALCQAACIKVVCSATS